VFSNGDTYEGEYMNSQRNGYGKKKQQIDIVVDTIYIYKYFYFLLLFQVRFYGQVVKSIRETGKITRLMDKVIRNENKTKNQGDRVRNSNVILFSWLIF